MKEEAAKSKVADEGFDAAGESGLSGFAPYRFCGFCGAIQPVPGCKAGTP